MHKGRGSDTQLEKVNYEGELKPCPFCGSENVKYLVVGIHGRLACLDCNKWLEPEARKLRKEEP